VDQPPERARAGREEEEVAPGHHHAFLSFLFPSYICY
jgi:hypothetical protein